MRQELTKDQPKYYWIFNIIASLGIIPAVIYGREIGSFWISMVFILLWYAIVTFFYLVFLYNRKAAI